MGIDLIPFSDFDSFHFNWTGYKVLHMLLGELDCDTSEIVFANDGEMISWKTCKVWSQMIHNALATKKIKRQFINEDQYQNGGYHKLVVTDKHKEDNDLVNLPEDEVTWLHNIIEFFEGCGGCRQY